MEEFFKHGRSTHLVILLHAYRQSPKAFSSIFGETLEHYPDADIFAPQLPLSTASKADPEEIAEHVIMEIDGICDKRKGSYEKVIFIGHSIGGLLARTCYVLARERVEATGAEDKWSGKVDRILLFAALNRGWAIGHHLGPFRLIVWSVILFFLGIIEAFSKRLFVINAVRCGAPFIVSLRVRWINLANRQVAHGENMPLTIQMLGSIDDTVAPDDNIDLVAGRHFIYLDVPYSGHGDVVRLDDHRQVRHGPYETVSRGFLRRQIFEQAMLLDEDALEDEAVIPSDEAPEARQEDVDHVVFVLHGIRDEGHWTQKIARRILKLSEDRTTKVEVRTETSSYGFFPMLPFLLPRARQKKVAWFMDQYAETRAKYPNAEISFVGHSNGTYLLGRALEQYSFCVFRHVVLAGSVIRTNYPWRKKVGDEPGKQVKKIVNFVATSDWVVAFFPKAIELLMLQDLGSGGHDGFDEVDHNLGFVKGTHSAAIAEENWDTIAQFVVTGDVPELPDELEATKQHWLIAPLAKVAWLVWVVIAIVLVWVARKIWGLDWGEAEKTALLFVYGWAVWKVITRL